MHSVEVAFYAQTWEQRVDLIRGNHIKEMLNILLSQASVVEADLESLKDEDSSYAVVAAFWSTSNARYPEGVVDHDMWDSLTDRLSEWNSNSKFLVRG